MNTTIVTEKLSVSIGETSVLRDISFVIPEGSVVGLLGPSGAGKTTLMRVLVGLQKPKSGKVTVLGMPAGDHGLRSQIGYMTQNLSIYSDLTVLQNLNYFAAVNGTSKAAIPRVVQRLQLAGLEKRIVSTLSGGQKTRVSLGAALLGKPRLLVLDEPTIGIDPLLRRELWQFLHEIAKEGTTLVISSHVMDEATHCNQILLLRDGTLLASGSTEDLKKKTGAQSIESAFLKLVGKRT